MEFSEILLLVSVVVMPVVSGIGSYIAATNKSKKDIIQLREQNKLEIEKLMNQHKMDLEALERKHQMEVEKMEIEHKHKIELMQKEMENKLGGDIVTGMISGVLNSPEVRNQMSKSLLQGMSKKKK